MRVALVATHFAEYAARLALALSARHTVQLNLARHDAEAELTGGLVRAVAGAVELRLHPRPVLRRLPWQGAALAAAVRGFAPEIVHAQEAAPWTLWAARQLGLPKVPFVLTVHDPHPHSGADAAAHRRAGAAAARLRRAADAVIVHGASLVPDIGGTPGMRVHAVPHGVLGDAAHRDAPPVANSFLFFGRIEAYKGLDVLLDAAALLRREGVAFRVIVAGSGGDLDRHRARIATFAPEVVLEEGRVPPEALSPLVARATAVLLPYRDATQSGVAALAFNLGRPVVASRVGALPEVIHDGVNGLLVPPGDPGALAAAMRRLVVEPGLAGALGRGALASAERELAWDAVAARTEAIYAALARGAARA